MGLSLCRATHIKFGMADLRVRRSQIAIQRQHSLALSDALGRAVRVI
jgi:hypothetical protein